MYGMQQDLARRRRALHPLRTGVILHACCTNRIQQSPRPLFVQVRGLFEGLPRLDSNQ